VSLWSASSADGGRSWTPPRGFGDFVVTTWDPSALVRRPDGQVTFAAVIGDQDCAWCSLVAYQSSDGGETWTPTLLELRTEAPTAVLLAGSGRYLTLQVRTYYCGGGGNTCPLFRSRDGGLTWSEERSPLVECGWYCRDGWLLAGDDLGNTYYRAGQFLDKVGVSSLQGWSHLFPGDFAELDVRAVSVLVRAPGDLEVVADQPWAATGGYPLVHFRVGDALLRDDSIGALSPRPDVGSRFPLREHLAPGAAPGMLDPDPVVLGDRSRPLVFYGVDLDRGRILLTKEGDRIRLTW
jgi:hypothetical protein